MSRKQKKTRRIDGQPPRKPVGGIHSTGKTIRSSEPRLAEGGILPVGIPEIEIAAWCDNQEGKDPEQVWLLFHIQKLLPDVFDHPIVVRFKSPQTLGFIIEELIRYRGMVWKDAPLIDEITSFEMIQPKIIKPIR